MAAKSIRIARCAVTIEQLKIEPKTSNIKNSGVVDVIAHDRKTDEIVLVMNEAHEWDGSDKRLHELQERFNTYASFLLDGEMTEAHPSWPVSGRGSRCVVRICPDARA